MYWLVHVTFIIIWEITILGVGTYPRIVHTSLNLDITAVHGTAYFSAKKWTARILQFRKHSPRAVHTLVQGVSISIHTLSLFFRIKMRITWSWPAWCVLAMSSNFKKSRQNKQHKLMLTENWPLRRSDCKFIPYMFFFSPPYDPTVGYASIGTSTINIPGEALRSNSAGDRKKFRVLRTVESYWRLGGAERMKRIRG